MKKKFILLSAAAVTFLNAQVLPDINSKGGAMTLLKGKFKMATKHKKDNMFNGAKEVKNKENLDVNVNFTLNGACSIWQTKNTYRNWG